MDFTKIVQETYGLLEEFGKSLDSPKDLERIKSLLRANRAPLRQLSHSYSEIYRSAKRVLLVKKETIYKTQRGRGNSQRDSENEAKLDTIPELEDVDRMKVSKDKCQSLLEDIESICIEISIRLKSLRKEIQYG